MGTGGQEDRLGREVGGDLERAVRGGGAYAKSWKVNGLCPEEKSVELGDLRGWPSTS